ncbi:Succinyl-CoA:(R)-benzylsuccinate CoA-transferase subunit BbsE [bacterium HR23]|nr:Succinyl-CoA:(R)-benzylsuccinate CoA-transferase subunit BbsE [bacterium HR23]
MADHLPLAPYRVIDLTQEHASLCGRLLGDMGADVLKVEPPQGDPARRRPPFYGQEPHPDRSLTFWFYNLNKRGLTLDISTADGQALLKRLVAKADILLESYPPGTMERWGLGYTNLSAINPRLIYTRITGFGQDGPYARYQAPDIVLQAMGGLMFITGDPDRPPLRIGFPQAYLHAAGEAVVGTLIALWERHRSGQGQQVDVSAQQAVVWSLMNATVTWDLNRVNITRQGAERAGGASGTRLRLNWECKDGYVCFAIGGGRVGGESTRNLVRWMEEEGASPDYLSLFDFETQDMRLVPQEEIDLLQAPIAEFFRGKTKEELWEGALKRRIILYPISNMQDLVHNRHLTERNFFIPVFHPELGREVLYPGLVPRMSATPPTVRLRPPLLGEHNQEVYCQELGLTPQELAYLRTLGVV